jgi:hypothetical protein
MNDAEKAMNKLTARAVAEFHKWEDEKYGDKTPLADMHVDMWVEAYILGYVSSMLDERREVSYEDKSDY